jgi:uncharacterized protein YjeT (DUF2065 family)
MNSKAWQRFRNLALFKLWITDKQLRRLGAIVAAIGLVVTVISLFMYFFFR